MNYTILYLRQGYASYVYILCPHPLPHTDNNTIVMLSPCHLRSILVQLAMPKPDIFVTGYVL